MPPISDDERRELQFIERELEALEVELDKFSAASRAKDEPPFCSFCGSGRNNVKEMLGGKADATICGECVRVAYRMITEGKGG